MESKLIKVLLALQYSFVCLHAFDMCDLAVIGKINFADGIGRQTIGIIDCLKDDLTIDFINTQPQKIINFKDIPERVQPFLTKKTHTHAHVAILEDHLTNGKKNIFTMMPDSTIKIAYTMFSASSIPQDWVNILNKYFDAAVVPDVYFVQAYEDAGVTIPIFVVPLGIYLEDFLQTPLKSTSNTPFVFGCPAAFAERKNHELLIESFAKEFGNNPNVKLIINSRDNLNNLHEKLVEKINKLNITNIELSKKELSWKEYIDFMKSLDCCISISKGEGFSIIPRESLALGIPAIVTNNTAQQTICDSGYVYSVPSEITLPAYYPHLGYKEPIGNHFTSSEAEVRQALRQLYINYSYYLQLANKGREWTKQYLYQRLKHKYLNLVKPQKIFLGQQNKVTSTYLMTNSQKLYQKYKSIKEI